MIRLGTVADDLTGATTAAALFARSGVPAIAYWDMDAAERAEPGEKEAVLLSTGSRAMKPEDAYRAVSRATGILKKLGAEFFQKRIDTTMRGGIGAEIDAMLDVLGGDYLAVVVPAMPQNHRIVVGGYSLIDGDLLSRTEVRHDVLTPVHESFIPRLLSAQTRRQVAQLTAECLMQGSDAIAEKLKTLYNHGVRVVVADAVSMDDIQLIADTCRRLCVPLLSVDPGPFTACLLGGGALPAPGMAQPAPRKTGTVLVAVGSTTEHSRRQLDALCADGKNERLVIRAERFLKDKAERDREVDRVARAAVSLLERSEPPRAIVLDGSSVAARFGTKEEQLRNEAHALKGRDPVVDSLGKILQTVLAASDIRARVAGLYLTGGDTMAAILARLDVQCVRVHDYIVPQVDLCRLEGGQLDGMLVASKGGMVGDEKIALLIVQKILEESARAGPV